MKQTIFEYIVYRIYKWYKENCPGNPEKELTIMKIMRLLFLISGTDIDHNLFHIFRFQAWQYGQMEPDIYDIYSKNEGKFNYFMVDRFKFKWLSSPENEIPIIKDNQLKERLDICIDEMIKKHPQTIKSGWYNLSELCKSFVSYKEYNKPGYQYTNIDKMILIYEPKHYF